jgi:hypothetical protein
MDPAKVNKAIQGAMVAFSGALVSVTLDGKIDLVEGLIVAATTVAAFLAVWGAQNAPADARAAAPIETRTEERPTIPYTIEDR